MSKAIPYPIRDGLRALLVSAGKRLHAARTQMDILKGGAQSKIDAAFNEYKEAVANLEFIEDKIRTETGVEHARPGK